VGALVSAIVAFSSITLKQSQVAVGFILTITCRDLAYFLGQPDHGTAGPDHVSTPIPLLREIPILGPMLFQQSLMTYFSIILIFLTWFWINKTRPGLMLQGIGEKPAAAYVRGANVQACAIFTPSWAVRWWAGRSAVHPGRKTRLEGHHHRPGRHRLDCLAITIFGGWNPIRVAFGAYLFAFCSGWGWSYNRPGPSSPPRSSR
jgi:general nucleoside transport system permease protein